MTKKKSRLPTETADSFGSNPFTILDSNDLSSLPLKTDLNHPKSKLEFPKFSKFPKSPNLRGEGLPPL